MLSVFQFFSVVGVFFYVITSYNVRERGSESFSGAINLDGYSSRIWFKIRKIMEIVP